MKLPAKIFENFKYDIHKIKDGESAILRWPDIAAYSEIFLAPDIDIDPEIVMRYMILMYCTGSPAYLQHNHAGKRKTLVMKWLEINADPDGTYPIYNDMLMVRGEGIRKRFVTFLMIQNSMDWAIMEHARAQMEELLTAETVISGGMIDVVEQQKKTKLIDDTKKQIESSMMRILSMEKTAAMENSVEWYVAQRVAINRPEVRIDKIGPMVSPEHSKAGKPLSDN